jgi:hypothetical protein
MAAQVLEAGMMRWHRMLFSVLALSSLTAAGIFPPVAEETVDIAKQAGGSPFVCKGEVTSAPEVKAFLFPGVSPVHNIAEMPHMTGEATVRIDTCFKGSLEGSVRIATDEYRPAGGGRSGGWHLFAPTAGEYLLLFLKSRGDRYEITEEGRGALPISRLMSSTAHGTDPLLNLENDLKAGLNDPDPEVVLKSICWLGSLRHLRSTAELISLIKTSDPIERAYIWEALLKLGDLSVVPEAADYLDRNPPVSHDFFMPRDRLIYLTDRVFRAFCGLRDQIALPYLERFTESPDSRIRSESLRALWEIGSFSSAPVFLRSLNDRNDDIDYIAMRSLVALAGGGYFAWVPTVKKFSTDPDFYVGKCREWWRTEGEAKARARSAGARLERR